MAVTIDYTVIVILLDVPVGVFWGFSSRFFNYKKIMCNKILSSLYNLQKQNKKLSWANGF